MIQLGSKYGLSNVKRKFCQSMITRISMAFLSSEVLVNRTADECYVALTFSLKEKNGLR